jgi:hypothetical protein
LFLLVPEDLFYEAKSSVSVDERRELMRLLGQFGLAELLEALRGGTPPHAAALTAVARAVSGFDEMRARLAVALGKRADALKANAALQQLMDQAHAVGDGSVYSAAQNLLDRPEMFPLRVLEMARLLGSGRVRPPAGLAEQAWVLITTGLAPVPAREAAQNATAWRDWAALTDGAGRFAARVMVRAWQLAVADDR